MLKGLWFNAVLRTAERQPSMVARCASVLSSVAAFVGVVWCSGDGPVLLQDPIQWIQLIALAMFLVALPLFAPIVGLNPASAIVERCKLVLGAQLVPHLQFSNAMSRCRDQCFVVNEASNQTQGVVWSVTGTPVGSQPSVVVDCVVCCCC